MTWKSCCKYAQCDRGKEKAAKHLAEQKRALHAYLLLHFVVCSVLRPARRWSHPATSEVSVRGSALLVDNAEVVLVVQLHAVHALPCTRGCTNAFNTEVQKNKDQIATAWLLDAGASAPNPFSRPFLRSSENRPLQPASDAFQRQPALQALNTAADNCPWPPSRQTQQQQWSS